MDGKTKNIQRAIWIQQFGSKIHTLKRGEVVIIPRVKPLIRPDPLEDQISTEIASGMVRMKIDTRELSRRTGINYSTLIKRIGKSGDIKTMRLDELIKIRRVLK